MMRMVLKLILAGSSMLAIAAAPAPLMTVTIKPSHIGAPAGKGDVDMTLAIPDAALSAGAPLHIGTIVPGMAYPLVIDGMTARDDAGALPLAVKDKKGEIDWSLSRATQGTLTLRYHVAVENVPMLRGGPPIQPRIDGDSVSSQGDGLIVATGITRPYRVALAWDLSAMQPGAQGVSSYGDGNVEIPAGPVSRLGDIVLMAGNHIAHAPDHAGAFSAVWGAAPPFDPRASMEWTAKLHKWMSVFWQDKTEPPYRVFLRYNPMNAGGGAALIHSFLATWGTGVTGESWKSILGHEMTHTWTANENDALGKWYTEGDAVYYQALLPWRAGLFSDAEYLADLNLTASRYYTNAMRAVPEDQVLAHFWEDTRIRVLPYDRGAMYFAVLNGKIRRASHGKHSVDDLVRVMNARRDAGEKLTEADWLALLHREIGEDGPAVHRAMLAGGLMLPESDDFGPCFHRVIRQIRRFDLGFDNASILGDRKIIKGLKPDSEAAKAGLRDGDEIAYGVALDAVQAEVGRTLALQVTRDGKTFPITYLPRGEAVDAYQWERTAGVPETRCKG